MTKEEKIVTAYSFIQILTGIVCGDTSNNILYEHDDGLYHNFDAHVSSTYLASIDDRQTSSCPGGQSGLHGEGFSTRLYRGADHLPQSQIQMKHYYHQTNRYSIL